MSENKKVEDIEELEDIELLDEEEEKILTLPQIRKQLLDEAKKKMMLLKQPTI